MIHFILLILWWYVKLPILLFNIFRWLTFMSYFFIWRWYYTRGVNTPKTQGRETSSFCSKMATWQRRDVFIARDVCAKRYEYATLNDTKQDWRIHRETNITRYWYKIENNIYWLMFMRKYMIHRKVLRYLYNDKATFRVINFLLTTKEKCE